MGRGGRREGSGRKKLGRDIRVKMEEILINEINTYSYGNNQSEKIRNCISIGLKILKYERNETNE